MPDARAEPEFALAPVRGRDDGASGPVLVLRPRLLIRLASPVLIVVGVLGAAAGFLAAAVLVPLGMALSVTWIPRIEIDANEFRVRGLRTKMVIPLMDIEECRLRRVPFGRPRPARRSYRFGRFRTTPIRFRVMRSGITLTQITTVWWDNWATLVRFVLSIPDMGSDSRTRGRLDRYGG